MLRVLDIDEAADRCFVVNEWGSGTSLDILLADGEPLSPTVSAWIVAEVADTLALAHDAGVSHGRLVPENVLIDHDGGVRLIGFAVDAALHGLPPGRTSTDVVDLVGLLYAALTARWAGISRSVVTAAPSQHGHVLRPRQVRAGIPRTLDALCDHVLNHGGDVDVNAAMVSDSLRDFLGPSAGAAEAWLARLDHPTGQQTVVLAALPDPPPREPDQFDVPDETGNEAGAEDDTDTEDRVGPADDPEATNADQEPADEEPATQAGMPIFHDGSDEVTWFAHSSEPAPPPPPFEPPPERPLFAPDPTDGQPARRPRAVPAGAHPSGSGFWPWESTGTGAGTGSGVLPAFVDDEEEDDRNPPGSSMLRLALIVAVCLLVLIGCVIAFNLGRGRTPLGTVPQDPSSRPTPSQTSSAPSTAAALTGVTATDFDPQGTPPEENPDQARFAVDGNPATSWRTSTYDQNFGPAGLKTGVGLVLDLGADHDVSEVDLTTVGSPTRVQIYVTEESPSNLQGAELAGQTTVTGTRGVVTVDPAVTGRYVVVWLTSLPAADGGYRGEIAEVVVKGE
jgi:serine/threonine protein kinase